MGENRPGFGNFSSARRLSVSNQDVFNLRNHKLSQLHQLSQFSQLSQSSPGIYNTEKRGPIEMRQQKVINDSQNSIPRSILIKPKEDSVSEFCTESEKDEKKPYYSLRLELQFTAFVFMFFFFVIVIPLSMIIIGSIYLHSCPVQIMIPVFLITGGSSFLFSIGLLRKLSQLAKQSEDDRSCYRKTFSFAIMFELGWFIAGCYWVYSAYEPDYLNEDSSTYCHKTLYLYSFWFLNAIFLSLSLFAVLFTVYILFGRDPTTADPRTTV